MSACTDRCDEEYEDCCAGCRRKRSRVARALCYSACMTAYAACLAACAAEATVEAVVDIAEAAAQFVRDHPELVVGTIVIIAGVVLIATTGPGGAIVLVAA